MEKIVKTIEELKEAVKHREQTIVIGKEGLARKITRFRNINPEMFQATEAIGISAGGEASAAASNMLPYTATGVVWAPCIAAFAIMVLGGLVYYALTNNYDVLVEGKGGLKIDAGDPKVRGRIKFILKSPE